jgi:1-aminocyclopropane-1-carboxylate deaminase/D-cysteine desulfhydrase-like pyridoxal-dependent ACC family enzyme
VSAARCRLAHLPTPLLAANRLADAVGAACPLLIKRDDLTGFGAAGAKARTLEFLLGAALRGGCDVLVTGGGPGSNFCPAAALAASHTGLDCSLVVSAGPAGLDAPNLRIAARAGAVLHPLGPGSRSRVDDAVQREAERLAAAGRHPFAMPRGGATPVGALGFAAAATELSDQLTAIGVEPGLVVIAVGSGASCAGLLAGRAGWPVLGVSVSRPLRQITATVHRLAEGCAAELGRTGPDLDRLEMVDAVGPGFGVPSARGRDAADIALRTEGLLLDHTYTAKAMAVLLARLRAGVAAPAVFWHTGGLVPAAAEYVVGEGDRDGPVTG